MEAAEQPVLDFYLYPPIGGDDWRYGHQTARVRVLEMHMLSRAILSDMAEAENFEQAVDLLAAGEYALHHGGKSLADIENMLKLRRSAVRRLFDELMIDKPIVELFKSRSDFANLRLALRRVLAKKPLGNDYIVEGNVSPQVFGHVFESENYELLPDYMAEAAERAIVAYYQNKDIRWVDYTIDRLQAEYNLKEARRLKSVFLLSLFRIQIDLTNIRTMLRLKFTESQQRDVFLKGGYVGLDKLEQGLELDYESAGQVFFATPYGELVETGANYLKSNSSFLAVEGQCENYLTGFLKTTIQITTGPQPIIAYLLMKENEIRNVRLILTAKRNFLDTKLILDRIL